MTAKFKENDIVIGLKTRMTVVSVADSGDVKTTWIDKEGKQQYGTFSSDSLNLASDVTAKGYELAIKLSKV